MMSLGAFLGISEPVIIVRHPQSQPLVEGGRATFSVEAAGSPPFRYQWQFNGVDIAGQTGPILDLANVTAANAGEYSVVVANKAGSAQSDRAILIVSLAPTILRQPQSRAALSGEPASFSVTASGTPPLGFQWRFKGADIPAPPMPVVVQVSSASEGDYPLQSERRGVRDQPGRQVDRERASPDHPAASAGQSTVGAPQVLAWLRTEPPPCVEVQRRRHPGATQPAERAEHPRDRCRRLFGSRQQPDRAIFSDRGAKCRCRLPSWLSLKANGTTGSTVASALPLWHTAIDVSVAVQRRQHSGATASSYQIGNVQTSHDGSYSVEVRNVAGSTQRDATLTVLIPPSIQSSRRAKCGSGGHIHDDRDGRAPVELSMAEERPDYRRRDEREFDVANAQADDAGSYTVVVTNPGGAVTSGPPASL